MRELCLMQRNKSDKVFPLNIFQAIRFIFWRKSFFFVNFLFYLSTSRCICQKENGPKMDRIIIILFFYIKTKFFFSNLTLYWVLTVLCVSMDNIMRMLLYSITYLNLTIVIWHRTHTDFYFPRFKDTDKMRWQKHRQHTQNGSSQSPLYTV